VTDKAPKAIGPYSQAVKVDTFATSYVVFTSGQLPVDPATNNMVKGGIKEQTEQVIKNLIAVLEASGADLESVADVMVLLADINDFAAMNEVYRQYFAQDCPARVAFQAAALPLGAKVEIRAIAFTE